VESLEKSKFQSLRQSVGANGVMEKSSINGLVSSKPRLMTGGYVFLWKIQKRFSIDFPMK
jgi:hypothetical protein